MLRSEWSVVRVVDSHAESVLNAMADEGYDVMSLIPRDKSDDIGAPSITIIARKQYEENTNQVSVNQEGPAPSGCQVVLTL